MSSAQERLPDHDDYVAALEVIYEVSEQVVEALGAEAVHDAQKITFRSGALDPLKVIRDANGFTAYTAEVIDTGEALSAEEESELDEGVADQAAEVLREYENRWRQIQHNQHLSEKPLISPLLNNCKEPQDEIININQEKHQKNINFTELIQPHENFIKKGNWKRSQFNFLD